MTINTKTEEPDDYPQDALRVGTQLEGYKVQSVLGRGAFGITYLAIEEHLNRLVAIKEYLPQDFAVRDETSTVKARTGSSGEMFEYGRDSFLKEAQTLVKFKHHNIVRVLTFFEQYDTAYLVMEYEEGVDFRGYLKSNPCPSQAQLLDIFIPINEGLAVVHKDNFIHRDIKPDNIYIRGDKSPVLLDFGAARDVVKNEVAELTRILTEGYAPYEQDNPAWANQGPWTDIYALGATLYFAVMGIKPAGASQRAAAYMMGKDDPYVSARTATNKGYSVAFLDAIDWALAFLTDKRPQSLIAWNEQLLLGDSDATVMMPGKSSSSDCQTPTGFKSASDDEETLVKLKRASETRGSRSGRAQKWILAAAGATATAIVGGVIYFMGFESPDIDTTGVSVEPVTQPEKVALAQPATTHPVENQLVADASDTLFVLVSHAMNVSRVAVVKLQETKVNEENIIEIKKLPSDSQRTQFIAEFQVKIDEALNDVDKNIAEYTMAVMRLKRYPQVQVENEVERYLSQPDYQNRPGYYDLGKLINKHSSSQAIEPESWKRDIYDLVPPMG